MGAIIFGAFFIPALVIIRAIAEIIVYNEESKKEKESEKATSWSYNNHRTYRRIS